MKTGISEKLTLEQVIELQVGVRLITRPTKHAVVVVATPHARTHHHPLDAQRAKMRAEGKQGTPVTEVSKPRRERAKHDGRPCSHCTDNRNLWLLGKLLGPKEDERQWSKRLRLS